MLLKAVSNCSGRNLQNRVSTLRIIIRDVVIRNITAEWRARGERGKETRGKRNSVSRETVAQLYECIKSSKRYIRSGELLGGSATCTGASK